MKDDNGEWIEQEEKLSDLAREFYKNLYKAEQCLPIEDTNLHFPSLNHSDRRSLNRMVSEPEVKAALFQMGGLKAPGSDGLPPCFFQKNWEVVGGSVVRFVKAAFEQGIFPSSMNESLRTLIPKQEVVEAMNQFRHIALCNVIA